MTSITGRPTYFASPNTDYKPDGLIFLGSILPDPLNVSRPLNPTTRPVKIPDLQETYLHNCQESIRKLRSNKLTIWTGFVQSILGVRADVGYGVRTQDEAVYHFKSLETKWFVPDDRFVSEAITAALDVQRYLKVTRRYKPLYMVTGVKIARGTSMKSSRSREHSTQLIGGVDGTPLGLPLSMGPSVTTITEHYHRRTFEASSDFVFAYKVVKITPRRKGTYETNDYTKGALYALDPAEACAEKVGPEDVMLENDISEVLDGKSTQSLDVEDDDDVCNLVFRA